MGYIKTIDNMFARIYLEDGNKILIGLGLTDIRVFKLNFLGIPSKKIHIFDINFFNYIDLLSRKSSKSMVEILANKLVGAKSLEKVAEICLELENNDICL